ncbi:hypothetical protein L1887_59151 [Cichorium endivia]|nr:hypothetical protein L1887_59151 [Cichorium endivia]
MVNRRPSTKTHWKTFFALLDKIPYQLLEQTKDWSRLFSGCPTEWSNPDWLQIADRLQDLNDVFNSVDESDGPDARDALQKLKSFIDIREALDAADPQTKADSSTPWRTLLNSNDTLLAIALMVTTTALIEATAVFFSVRENGQSLASAEIQMDESAWGKTPAKLTSKHLVTIQLRGLRNRTPRSGSRVDRAYQWFWAKIKSGELEYVEGANRLFLERDGFYIRRAEHPQHRYWRMPKGKLLDDLDLLFHRLMELTEGRFNESWQTFSAKLAAAQQSPDRQAFTWGLTFRIAPLAQGGILLSGDYHPGAVAVSRHDMGLGKTRQAIIAAAIRAGDSPILVITLSTLIINWQREIQMVYPEARIGQQVFDPSLQWTIINYERLGDYVLQAGHFEVMIIDEAHRLKEPTAAWTRHGFDIAAKFAGSPEFRKNLREAIGDWMLRRRKDVLTELKGKQRQTLPVELSVEERREYDRIRLEDRPSLARLGSLRQLLEQVKVRVVMELLCELDVEDKVILFCEFKDTVSTLRAQCEQAGYSCVTVVGSDSVGKRQKAIDRFQSDTDTRVFAATTSAAGTGNNLTAANYVMFLGLPWTPGLLDQAEDRAYRNGQLRMVVVKIPLVENTIDQMLWQMLLDKRQLASDLIEPDAAAKTRSELLTYL